MLRSVPCRILSSGPDRLLMQARWARSLPGTELRAQCGERPSLQEQAKLQAELDEEARHTNQVKP